MAGKEATVRIRVSDLGDEVRRIDFREPAEGLNETLDAVPGWTGQRFEGEAVVRGELYRTGTDVHFGGEIEVAVHCACARCLKEFLSPMGRSFRLVLLKATGTEREDEEDVGCDRYEGEEIDLWPLAREQALLGLESRRICSESCKGLCVGCGADLNEGECGCGKD